MTDKRCASCPNCERLRAAIREVLKRVGIDSPHAAVLRAALTKPEGEKK